jgi:hypothetical protein
MVIDGESIVTALRRRGGMRPSPRKKQKRNDGRSSSPPN